ncbi:MAG: Gfo/Idh/MocA family oxidoreductase [Planctomycetes bacterium]|nr:Gfo/Idh/MocA family oxidoreductase [Planctomycetota bacterium]
MAKVRIGFCGVGAMGQCAHLKNYYTLPDCQVVALAELREKTGKAVAQHYRVPKVYREAAEMLASEELDAIVASQPFTRHGTLIPELLAAKKPVFTEKPLAGSIEAGQRILDALAASGTWMMVGYHKRSDPASMHAKAQIDALKATGELGRMRLVRILMPAGDWVANGFAELIREDDPNPQLKWDPPASDMDEAAYKAYVGFVNYYIHQVNLLRYLLGEPYKVTHADPSGVVLVARSASGVAGVIEMSPYRTTVEWQESALVAFEKGYVKLELPAPLASNRPGRVEILRDPGDAKAPEASSPHLPWIHAMRQQAMNFVAAVRGDRPPTCTAQEAMEDLKVARDYLRLWKGV